MPTHVRTNSDRSNQNFELRRSHLNSLSRSYVPNGLRTGFDVPDRNPYIDGAPITDQMSLERFRNPLRLRGGGRRESRWEGYRRSLLCACGVVARGAVPRPTEPQDCLCFAQQVLRRFVFSFVQGSTERLFCVRSLVTRTVIYLRRRWSSRRHLRETMALSLLVE